MYLTKVLLHHMCFVVLCTCVYIFSNLGILYTLLSTPLAYIVSYFLSTWHIKLLYSSMKVNSENKCVLITGCASGFGYQSAIQLNKLGFKVFATCRDPNSEGAKRLPEMAADGKKMIVLGMDVTKDGEVERTYETVVKSMTSSECLFGLVNNAGVVTATELEFGQDLNDCKNVIDVNLISMIRVTRKFLPLIRQSKGRIVNVESLGGLVPLPFSIYYAVSKSAAISFSDNLRFSMYKFGVSVISILPWIYRTQLNNSAVITNQFEDSFKNSSEAVRKAYGVKFVEKVKKAIKKVLDIGTISNDAPDAIVTALTCHEPDPRYIVAPTQWKLLAGASQWVSKDSSEV